MQVFFIEENKKANILKKNFNYVDINNDKIILNCNKRKRYSKKCIEKIKRFINQYENSKVVISNDLKKDLKFINYLESNNISISNYKNLFKILLFKIIDNVCIKNKIIENECKISILSNNYNKYIENVIKKISNKFKKTSIITNRIDLFKAIQSELYENKGIILLVTNNKRKALSDSDIIINIDFPQELFNKFLINDECIIIDLEKNIYIKKKRFCGIIINDFNISLKKNTDIYKKLLDYNNFNLKDILEFYILNDSKILDDIVVHI